MRGTVLGSLAAAAFFAAGNPGFAADDWSRMDAPDGLVYYRCDTPACTVGAVVSCRVWKADKISSTDRYREAMAVQAAEWTRNGAVVRLGEPKRTSVGSWTLYQHPYTVRQAHRQHTQFRGGFLSGTVHGFSIVSSSNDATVTERNIERVAKRLMSTSIEDALERCTSRAAPPAAHLNPARSRRIP